MAKRKKLFITGAAGLVGSGLRRHLKDRYDFRLMFHRNIPEVEPNDEVVVSDIANFEQMVEACEGIDAVRCSALRDLGAVRAPRSSRRRGE